MGKRRRKSPRRRKRTPTWLILVQIALLGVVLTFLVLFRDFIAESASTLFSGMSAEDIEVSKKVDAGAKDGGESIDERNQKAAEQLPRLVPDGENFGRIKRGGETNAGDAGDEQ